MAEPIGTPDQPLRVAIFGAGPAGRVVAPQRAGLPALTSTPSADIMSLLESRGLTKDFGGLRAVHEFDFSMTEGEIVGLIGPNGSGKTTVFNVVTGLYKPTAGRVEFGPEGRQILGLAPHAVTALGIARTFQNQRLFNQMSVLENLEMGAYTRTDARWVKPEMERVLTLLPRRGAPRS